MKQFDDYLKKADIKQKLMIYTSFILILGLLLNQFVPPMLEKRDTYLEEIDRLERDITRNTAKRYKQRLKKKNQQLLVAKEEIQKAQEDIFFVMSNINKIEYAFFSDKKWANSIDDILKQSVQRDIKIISLKNESFEDIQQSIIKHKKTITINGTGTYPDILAFVQYIENINTLLEFKVIELKQDKDGVAFSLAFNLYGVGL